MRHLDLLSKTHSPDIPIGVEASDPPDHSHPHDHAVQFYDDDGFLATVVGEFVAGGLRERQPSIVIATREHRKAFVARLRAERLDVPAARRDSLLTLLDARQSLDRFMDGRFPDPKRFRRIMGRVIARSLRVRGAGPVRAYGEMVDLLWKDGNTEGAIRLEEMWNELAQSYDFSLLCAYSMGNFYRAADSEAFRRICGQHTHVVPTEAVLKADGAGQLLELSLLQQRSRALETEIIQRELLEQRLRETVIALQEREEDLRDVLDNAAEGIHLVTAEGIIRWANVAELDMLGYAPDEYIGHHITEFHVDEPVITDMLSRLASGETLRDYEARLRRKDGTIRSVLVNSNVRWRDGKFLHTRCFSRDVTELRRANEELDAMLERERAARLEAERARLEAERTRLEADRARALAEQANRAKSDFLAVMSHELRTPLNAIGGHAELMELGIHGPVSEQQRDALDRIQRSQRMLLGHINQVLNYARIESGSVRYDVDDIPLDELIRATEALVSPQLRAKGLRYVYSGCPAGVAVHADGEKLQQILLNLLTNAVKFTDRGGRVWVDVDAMPLDVLLRVHDTGVGIAPDKVSAIFDPFVQVDSNYTRTKDGVGLGLAISRDLAQGMNGDISVASVPGAGSVFTVRLPRSGAT